MHDIQLAATDDEIAATFNVMRQLRTHFTELDAYVEQVRRQQATQGYRLAALRVGGEVRALAGFRVNESLSWGRYVYVDDLVSDSGARSHGFGAALLNWVGNLGREHGCTQLHLDSGVQRHGAHRFYLRERMDITCHHFKRDL